MEWISPILCFIDLLLAVCTLITEAFPGTRKMARKEKPLKKSCQNPVELARSMTQYNFRTRLATNLFSGHFDKAGTILASRYEDSSCARMTRGAKTGYTTSLTSVISPNSWTTYRACSTGFWLNFFTGFSFRSIFRAPWQTSVIRVRYLQCEIQKRRVFKMPA